MRLFFIWLFVSERKQTTLMADEKSPARISHRIFATKSLRNEDKRMAGHFYNGRELELLIPASSLEVLKTAVIFGADAVYIGGEAFGLRAKAKNFSMEDMKEGIAFAHAHDVKVYVTANILAHNYDMEPARNYFQELAELAPDAIIVADPGMIMLAMVLTSVGLPVDGIALVAGVDRIFDMGRTTVNITGDAACTIVVSNMESRREARKGAKQ